MRNRDQILLEAEIDKIVNPKLKALKAFSVLELVKKLAALNYFLFLDAVQYSSEKEFLEAFNTHNNTSYNSIEDYLQAIHGETGEASLWRSLWRLSPGSIKVVSLPLEQPEEVDLSNYNRALIMPLPEDFGGDSRLDQGLVIFVKS